MSRPRKPPTIEQQMQALIAQAISEKQFKLAKDLTDLLAAMEPKGEGDGSSS